MFVDYFRHAESDWVWRAEEAKRRGEPAKFGGRMNDVDLSPAGLRQCPALKRFRERNNINPVAYYSSPAKRAKRTFMEGLGVDPITIDDLQERDWGKWTGEFRSIAETSPFVEQIARLGSGFTPPDGESDDQLRRRGVSAFWEMMGKHDAQSNDVIWVCSHRNLIGETLAELLGWPEGQAARKPLDLLSRTRLKVVGKRVELVSLNESIS
ncbi:MAG TPA: histidine phosphatase family protein [Candidatus Saccharimonadales bacterium]